VRLIGTDAQASQLAQGIQKGPDGQPQADIALKTAVSSADYIQQSLQNQALQAQANMRSLGAAAEAAGRGENAELAGRQSNRGFLGDLADVAKVGLQVYGAVEKRRGEAQAQTQELAALKAQEEMALLKVDMQGIMRNDAGGRVTAEKRIQSIIQKYNLSAKDATKLLQEGMSELQSLESERTKRIQSEADKIADNKQQQLIDQHAIKNANIMARLGSVSDAAGTAALFDELNGRIAEIQSDPNLTELQKSSIIANLTGVAKTQTFASAETQAKAAVFVQNVTAYQEAMTQINAEYAQTGDLTTRNQRAALAAQRYGIPAAIVDAYDPAKQTEAQINVEKQEFTLKELEEKRYISKLDAQKMTGYGYGAMAADIMADPNKRAQFEAQFKRNPNSASLIGIKNALDAADGYTQARDDLAKKGAQLNTAIARIKRGDTEDAIRALMGDQQLAQQLGLTAQINALMAGKVNTQSSAADIRKSPEYAALNERLLQDKENVVRALENEYAVEEQAYRNAARKSQQYGFINGRFDEETYRDGKLTVQRAQQQMQADQKARQQGGSPGATPNFSQFHTVRVQGRYAASTPFKGKTAVLPFRKGAVYSVSDNFSQPRDGGSRRHMGEDIQVAVGTPIIAQLPGKVVDVYNQGDKGWGKLIEVQYSDGSYHLFAHLSNNSKVRVGQIFQAGQTLALSGNTGSSSGPHLHWEVSLDGRLSTGRGRKINPYAWATQIAQNPQRIPRQPRGMQGNQPPAAIPKGAIQVRDGYLLNGQFVNTRQQRAQKMSYTPASPLRGNNTSVNRADYPKKNDPTANYGYKILAEDRPFAAKIAQVSDRLGIPAQWLVDVMAYETGGSFNTNRWNDNKAPAVGLIQFYQDPGDPGYKTIAGKRYSLREISQMSRVRQMDLVYDYMSAFKGRLNSPRAVLGAIFGWDTNLPLGAGDGDITKEKYLQELGRHAGRKYYGPGGRPIGGAPKRVSQAKVDTRIVPNCTTCVALAASGSVGEDGSVPPHQRQLMSGNLSDYIA